MPGPLLIFNRRELAGILRVYVRYYNGHRPRRALDLRPPTPRDVAAPGGPAPPALHEVERRDLLSRLLHEYRAAT